MTNGIYITPSKFVSFQEARNLSSLKQEIASRSAAYDFTELIGLLPDPDPVLAKRGDGVEILESLTADPHLISVMQSRKLGVLKQEFKWTPGVGEDDKPTSQSEALCADLKRDLARIGMRDLISSILDAPYYGMTPVELTFEPVQGRLKLRKLEAKPVRWFGFDAENEPRFKSMENEEEGEKLPWGKFVFARHFPTYDNPYGLRLLSRCFWPITFKKGGLKFWVTFMEKYGMPFLLGHYAKGTTPDEQQAMLDKLEKMVNSAVAVVPDGDRIEMLGGSGKTGGGYMVFDKMRQAMDAEISKVIQGQTLTTETGNQGSYSLGKVHAQTLTAYQESDRLLTKTTLDEIARIYSLVNTDNVPPPVCTFFEAEDPQKDFADRDRQLEENGRFKLKKSYYIRRYGFQDDDFELLEKEGSGQPFDHSDPEGSGLSAQDALDTAAGDHIRDGAGIFEGFKAAIRVWLESCKDFAGALANVTTLFDILSSSDLRDSVFAALVQADRLGTDSVPATLEHAEAVWGAGKPFREQLDFFKAKSFTIACVARDDVVAMVKDELEKAMKGKSDIREFRKNLDHIFRQAGLNLLHPHRIDTIYRTNMQQAFSAARYLQMTKPHILKARPFWKYVAVKDGSTRPAHKAMDGRVFHHDNPVWRVWYPPNGFNCRCQVISLSQREVDRDNLHVERTDPSGSSFEIVDKDTGEVKFYKLEPDQGFTPKTGSLEKLMSEQRKKKGGRQVWREKKDQPGPVELGRPAKGAIPDKFWQTVKRGPYLEKLMSDEKITERKALDVIERLYRKEMGIAPLETQSTIRTKDGSVVVVTLQALAHAMHKRIDARERFIPYLRHTIEDPYEILLTEYTTPTGKTKFRKKYIGLFRGTRLEGLVIIGEIQADNTVLWNIMNTKKQNLDRQRRGVKIIYGK